MALKIVYIAGEPTAKQQRAKPADRIHQLALAAVAERRIKDRQKAELMFAKESADLEVAIARLEELERRANN